MSTEPTTDCTGFWGDGYSPIPCSLPDICLGNSTWGAITYCAAENPTMEQACQLDAYRPYLECPAKAPTLPQTGASVSIGGLGLAALMVGVALVRLAAWNRRGSTRGVPSN
jgi:hypothetical protein